MRKLTLSQEELHHLFDYSDGWLLWRNPYGLKTRPGTKAGTLRSKGYIEIGILGTLYQAHRLIYAWHTGEWPDEVDHKDRRRSNNKIENLRPISRSDNLANSTYTSSSSGYRGVSFRKGTGRYRARIRKNGKLHEIGEFDCPKKASEAYEAKRQELFPNIFQI